MNTKCPYCGVNDKLKRATRIVKFPGAPAIIRSQEVPITTCDACGQYSISAVDIKEARKKAFNEE